MKLCRNGYFEITNYQNINPFSSFLSGIAGKLGVPIWAFYVNRGQGIASFGIGNKDQAIMEFHPANRSYHLVSTKGFRTFVKTINSEEKQLSPLYEPFSTTGQNIESKMIITPYSLTIEEVNQKEQLKVIIQYFILPNEGFGALVRRLNILNLSKHPKELEILDGMPELLPFGITNQASKMVSQTITAWCRVYNLENRVPFYRLKATAEDIPEVKKVEKGHFYLSFTEDKLLSPLVDSKLIFGQDTGFKNPEGFIRKDLSNFACEQKLENQFPAAMTACKTKLSGKSNIYINSLFGHVSSQKKLQEIVKQVMVEGYLESKYIESQKIHQYYLNHIFTASAKPEFDYYCQQTLMDNSLRGGFPVNLGNNGKSVVFHLFSRKHGDLERDYNFFHLEPSFYSQGNGNYRDVNQNRRCDNFFNSKVKDYNIKVFTNLIQADGYNPLVVRGVKFQVNKEYFGEIAELVNEGEKVKQELVKLISEPFTPGELANFIINSSISITVTLEEFIQFVLTKAASWTEAEFGDGYWIDHWTYILDLIENYLAIYPEKKKELLLEDHTYTFFDSYIWVKPRKDKYVLTDSGLRQLKALQDDLKKKELIVSRKKYQYQLRGSKGKGDIYYTNLFVKLLTIILNKITSLDPGGVGIEMEANKPGWYDALNGLPGIFGSSTPETMELKRLVDFLIDFFYEQQIDKNLILKLPIEISEFMQSLKETLIDWYEDRDDFKYWDQASTLKEVYRRQVFYGFDGREERVSVFSLLTFLELISTKLENAVNSAFNEDSGLYTTYYYYLPTEYEVKDDEANSYIQINSFKQIKMPVFLESQVRVMKIIKSQKEIKELYQRVLNSELYDPVLKMYRLNGDLEEMPVDIGRARAFTPGWLENGSIWLHMEYKYLLELIKSGLYKEFFHTMKDVLIPFQSPEVYGRSILENSSFILSSLNPDKENHGRGYIARLSGSTAEFIQIWTLMVLGTKPFKLRENELYFSPTPILKSSFFTTEESKVKVNWNREKGKVSEIVIPKDCFAFRFLGRSLVIYHNPERLDTYNPVLKITGYKLVMHSGEIIKIRGFKLDNIYTLKLRKGEIKRLDVYLQS